MNDIQNLPSLGLREDLSALSGHLAAGRLSSAALTARYLQSIDRDNPRLGAFTFVAAEAARAAARESDARRAAGVSLGALDGIPVALKANIAVRGWPYTAGLRFRQQEIAAQDAFLVRRLRAAGAVLLGLTNMDEGALGAEGMNPWYLTTQNPLRAGYCAGGSSSGSAAAVAADLCAFAVGTDTIGSLRIPAAFCGCASIKPSFGLVSVGGIVPVNLRFDHAGPLTRSARDLPLALAALAGYDNACAVSVAAAPVVRWPADRPVTIGYAVGFAELMVSDEIVGYYNHAIATLRQLGHKLLPVDLKRWDLPKLRRAVLTLCELEMWRSHRSRLNDTPEDYSPGLRAFVRYGGKLSGEDLADAETRIARFYQDWQDATADLDAVVLPTVACTSFPLGERRPQNTADLTAIASATGVPAVQLPLPAAAGQLPGGLQLLGRAGQDENLVGLACSLEARWQQARLP